MKGHEKQKIGQISSVHNAVSVMRAVHKLAMALGGPGNETVGHATNCRGIECSHPI